MEETAELVKSERKFYKSNYIWPATYLGGPLVAGYLIAENFKALNEPDKAKVTWLFTVIGTIIIFGGIFIIPEDINVPNYLIPLVYSGIAGSIAHFTQGEGLKEFASKGGESYTAWRALAVSLIGLLLTLSFILIPLVIYFVSGSEWFVE